MSALVEAAREINDFLARQGWQYCVVGGIALSRVGEPRTTQDIDLCLLTGIGQERDFVERLLETFESRIAQPAEFAELNRVLLLTSSNHIGIDIALAWTHFEQKMIDRAKPFQYAPGVSIPTASAEDILVTKAFASRPQDWIDVEGILARQRNQLDWDYILGELRPLCGLKEAPEIIVQLLQMRAKIDSE